MGVQLVGKDRLNAGGQINALGDLNGNLLDSAVYSNIGNPSSVRNLKWLDSTMLI